MTDYDPRIVELYDVDNPDGPDHDFYRTLADAVSARRILDLGCGTGLLTTTVAGQGRTVVGVDPSVTMLAYARRRPGAEAVTWVDGDSSSIPQGPFDYAVMTGNVAQHVPEADWTRTLRDLRQALDLGGVLAFETRNPTAHAWESWASEGRTTRDTPQGPLVEWTEAVDLTGGTDDTDGTVRLVTHNLFVETNDMVTETLVLAFRERSAIESQLSAAGFVVEAIYGDWLRTPFTADAPLMVFVARAR